MSDSEVQIQDQDMAPRDPIADLAAIRAMMEAGRRRICVDGIHMIIWGGLLGLAFGLQYLSVIQVLPRWNLEIWLPVMVIGWVASFRVGSKDKREEDAGNLAVIAYASVWFGIGVSATLYFLTTIVIGGGGNSGMTIMTSAMFGSAYFVISRVTGVKALLVPSIGWWIIMAYTVQLERYTPGFLILLSAAAFLLIMAPGLYLRNLANSRDAE